MNTVASSLPAGSLETPRRWQQIYRNAISDPDELCRRLHLASDWVEPARRAAQTFGLRVPEGFVRRMRLGDPDDPLLRQVLPLAEELRTADGFTTDPLAEQQALAAPGLLHKYAGRVLMVASGACAVHCRYCFRRHFPYDQSPHGIGAWQPSIAEIAADESIREVLLSGGDPLSLTDAALEPLVEQLTGIPHLERLRIHTRLPVVIPERVTDTLLELLNQSRLQKIVVLHINHAQEIDESVVAMAERLQSRGFWLLNQAVLLRGVNDSVEALADLSLRLVGLRIQPYYLHQLDRVAGAAHFEVPVNEGRRLMTELRARLPGYAVPRYVQEIPGEPNKTVLA